MITPLLATKLHVPPARPELVSRPRLMERLSAGLHRRLTLVSAPAGFGKTTLLAEWAASCGRPVAWVTLDRGDNDPAHFWAYAISALQTVSPEIGKEALVALQPPGLASAGAPPSSEEILAGLVNEISAIPRPLALVLDDYHVISEPRVHDELTFLLSNLPPPLHLIVSGRADPPWPLARLRARAEVAELRASDLRFTLEEVSEFLGHVLGLDLSVEDITALEKRTEGWIAGLQMAAISIQGRMRTGGLGSISAFIRDFSASNRFILDYLVEEVLDQQGPAVQGFLLETSILNRMTASLCDALTGEDDTQSILTALERANLFLIPLDEQRRWYRYHQLFRDLLRRRFERSRPDQVPALHGKASEWYEENGLVAEAVAHALAAGDVERVAHLVAGNALAIMGRDELSALTRWLNALPEDAVRSRPWLCVSHAWVLAFAGQLDAAQARLRDAETASSGVMDDAETRHIASHATAIESYVAGLRGDFSRAAELARKALERLPESDLMARGFATSLLGSTLRWAGDLEAAAQASAEAISISEAVGDNRIAGDTFCDLAALQLVRGQLHGAAATCRDALRLAGGYVRRGGRRLPVTGFAYARMSAVLREWNDLEAAVAHAREGVELCEQWGWADGLVFSYSYLAGALQAADDADGALRAILTAKRVASNVSPFLRAYVAAQEAVVLLGQGDFVAASRWASESGLAFDDVPSLPRLDEHLALARVLIAQGKQTPGGPSPLRGPLNGALDLLGRLLEMTQAAGASGRAIEVLVLQAMAFQALGAIDQALSALQRALALAEPEGYVRIFIGEGPPMHKLLRQVTSRGTPSEYVRSLLAAFDAEGQTSKGRAEEPIGLLRRRSHPPPPRMIEALSERELQVLRLLTTDLSSVEIAAELFVAVSTIRTHIKRIYGKLDAHSRIEAIQRAGELGLL